MLPVGPAVKVTVYLNQDTGAEHGFLHDEILRYLQSKSVNGATAYHPHSGFGMHGRLHVAGAGDVAGLHLPVIIYFVETREKMDAILPTLLAMVTDGLVEAHPTEILKNISTSERIIS
jgi:uncharacterized protein